MHPWTVLPLTHDVDGSNGAKFDRRRSTKLIGMLDHLVYVYEVNTGSMMSVATPCFQIKTI